jgi:hypothetical protein
LARWPDAAASATPERRGDLAGVDLFRCLPCEVERLPFVGCGGVEGSQAIDDL